MMATIERKADHVLLVDDDGSVASALGALLTRAGYHVTIAATPREAEAMLDERFDLLLLDLRMPGMRGDAFYYLARARQPWLAERTLFMTGDITASAEEIVAQTHRPLLLKPFRTEALLRALEQVAPREGHREDRAS